jgi:hypothetical protein
MQPQATGLAPGGGLPLRDSAGIAPDFALTAPTQSVTAAGGLRVPGEAVAVLWDLERLTGEP